MSLVFRTDPSGSDATRKPGWRIALPIFPVWKRAYAIERDAFVTGWWWGLLATSFEPLVSANRLVGFSIRVGWGWRTWGNPRKADLENAARPYADHVKPVA